MPSVTQAPCMQLAADPPLPRTRSVATKCLRCATQQLQQQLISLSRRPEGEASSLVKYTQQQHHGVLQQQQQQHVPWQWQCDPQLALATACSSSSRSMSIMPPLSASFSTNTGTSSSPSSHHEHRSSTARSNHVVACAAGPQASSSQQQDPYASDSTQAQPLQQQQQPQQQPVLDGLEGIAPFEQQQQHVQAQAGDQQGLDTPGVRAALAALKWYKGFLSPSMASTCRFQPTCSVYSMDSYNKYGVAKGTVLTAWRLLRCNPWGGSGYDPTSWPPVGLAPLFTLPYSAEVAVVVGTAAFLRFSHALLFE